MLKRKQVLEEIEVVNYEGYSLGHLQEIIEGLENRPPLDKRKKEYKSHIDNLNSLFKIYNKKAGQKIYRIIK